MELTGKCATEFMYWYVKSMNIHKLTLVQFRNMPDNVQWGVYVDFFDSVGLHIIIERMEVASDYKAFASVVINEETKTDSEFVSLSRQEVRKEAIIKACELYNEKEFVFPHDLDKLTPKE